MLVHDLIYYRYPIQGKHLEPNSKTGKIDILFKDRNPVKNHTLLGGKTYLPNTYMGVPPPPPGASTKRKPQYLIQYAAA